MGSHTAAELFERRLCAQFPAQIPAIKSMHASRVLRNFGFGGIVFGMEDERAEETLFTLSTGITGERVSFQTTDRTWSRYDGAPAMY